LPLLALVFLGKVAALHTDSISFSGGKSFANFLNRLSLKRIEDDHAGLF
jgi:hypothetical protein